MSHKMDEWLWSLCLDKQSVRSHILTVAHIESELKQHFPEVFENVWIEFGIDSLKETFRVDEYYEIVDNMDPKERFNDLLEEIEAWAKDLKGN